jgi:hypothetical protein
MGNQIYFKIAGYVNLDMLHMFAKISSFGSIRPTNMAAVTKNRTYGKIAGFW